MLYDLIAATQSGLDVDFCESPTEDDCMESFFRWYVTYHNLQFVSRIDISCKLKYA